MHTQAYLLSLYTQMDTIHIHTYTHVLWIPPITSTEYIHEHRLVNAINSPMIS